jgi:hypothetical protein
MHLDSDGVRRLFEQQLVRRQERRVMRRRHWVRGVELEIGRRTHPVSIAARPGNQWPGRERRWVRRAAAVGHRERDLADLLSLCWLGERRFVHVVLQLVDSRDGEQRRAGRPPTQ